MNTRISRRALLAGGAPFSIWGFQSGRPSNFLSKAVRTGEAAAPKAGLCLWYRQPAGSWVEALPAGNGRLGAMVFGGVETERIQLNEETIWAGKEHDSNNPQALRNLPEVRRLLFEGKELEATELGQKTMIGIPGKVDSYQPLADLRIDMPQLDAVSEYRRWLDLETAVAVTEFSHQGARITREVFVSAADQAVVVRLAGDKPGRISAQIRMWRQQDAMVTADPSTPNLLILRGQVNGDGLLFQARLAGEARGGALKAEGGALIAEGCDEVVLRLTAASNFNHPSETTATSTALAKGKRPYAELKQRHVADHQVFFGRVALELPAHAEISKLPTDERLARVKAGDADESLAALYFQYGRYLLLGSSRPGTLPANLQGVWNEHIKAPWNADYHTNINLQMNYWLAEPTNLTECHLPLFDYMDALSKPGSRTAKVHYGAKGWVVHHLSDIFGYTAPADGIWGVWPMGAAWLAQHPWEHYLYTQDREFLARRGYPLMKGAAEFILDFLVEAPAGTPAAGKLVTAPSHSPENSFRKADGTKAMFTYAATMDIEICRDLLANCISASKALGADAEFRQRCEQALGRLPEIRISPKTGRVMEWIEDYDEPEPQHRHVSHMFGLHPSQQIDIHQTPELAAAARKVLEVRGDKSTGWSTAWKMNFWARLQDPERAYKLWTMLITTCTLPNLFDTHPPFQIDGNFGGTAGIAEILLQSHLGEIRLLPALPKAWHTGKVRGLKARGAFEVEMEWAQGRLARAVLKSSRGNPVRLRTAGKVTVRQRGKTVRTRVENGLTVFETAVNQVYEITTA